MFSRLTTTGKILAGLVIAGILFGLGYFLYPNFKSVTTASKEIPGLTEDEMDSVLTIGLNTFGGYAVITYLNDGVTPNKNSRMYKDFGLLLDIKQMDDRNLCKESLISDKTDAIYTTTDISPAEMSADGELAKAGVVQFFKIDNSGSDLGGADVIVGTRSYNSVSDLKPSTKIACAFPTASSTLLINWLDAGGKTVNDVEVVYVESGAKAAELFTLGQVDLAVVWSPDDVDCINKVKGSHVVTSTKFARSIIMDGLIAKRSTIDKKFNLFVKLTRAWMVGNSEMTDPAKRDLAAKSFATAFNFKYELVKDAVDKIRCATYGDNLAFFGLDATYTGIDGDDLYTRMAKIYSKIKDPASKSYYAVNPLPWVKVSYSGVIESIKDLTGIQHAAEGQIQFEPSSKETMSKTPMATKHVTIQFALNSFELDNTAKDIIDREVGTTLNSWLGARIRIEGNTDKTGNRENNKALSYKRANAVKNYLMKTYDFQENRFDIIGNGQDKPIPGGTNEMNRRTDFGLIGE